MNESDGAPGRTSEGPSTTSSATTSLRDDGVSRAAPRRDQQAMQPLEWMRAIRRAGLTRSQLAVLDSLALRMGRDGTGFASHQQLADDTGVNRTTVWRCLATASELGWVRQTRRGHRVGSGTALASEYVLSEGGTAPDRSKVAPVQRWESRANVAPVQRSDAANVAPVQHGDTGSTLHSDGPNVAFPRPNVAKVRPNVAPVQHPEVFYQRSSTRDPLPECGNAVVVAPAVAPAARPRDVVWDAVMDACQIDTASIPGSARGAYNRAVADLKQANAEPDEIARRAMHFRMHWPDITCTPTALARRWAEIAEPPRRIARGDMVTLSNMALVAKFQTEEDTRAEAARQQAALAAWQREQERTHR